MELLKSFVHGFKGGFCCVIVTFFSPKTDPRIRLPPLGAFPQAL